VILACRLSPSNDGGINIRGEGAVRGMRVVLALVLLIGVPLFAGCAGKASPDTSGTDALGSLEAREVDVAAGSGAIKGIVVDEAIRPLAKATVAIQGQGTRVTDAIGQFTFTDLKPGVYFLVVNATHYVSTQTSVEVKAGEVATARLQMASSNDPTPYHVVQHFRGNMALYLSFASYALELVVPNSALCTCTFNITANDGAKTFIYEATGNPLTHNPAPVYGTIYWEFIGNPQDDIRSAHGDFPVYQVFKRDSFANETTSWTVRLTGSQWVHYNTDFDIYLTTFYYTEAPKDWSFVKGDT